VTSIPGLIDRAARWFGDGVAVIDGDRRPTFHDVNERSNRLANALHGLSPEKSSRVALLMPNCLEFVESDLGIIKAGKVKVPINTRLGDDEREHVLRDSGADTAIFDHRYEDAVRAAATRLPELRHLISIGGKGAEIHDYETLISQGSSRPPRISYEPDDPNFILYTSGTTGRPKGATATNASRMAATLNMLQEELEVRPGDGMVHVGSMAHGSGSKTLAYFLRGARNITVNKFEPEDFLAIVERERATGTFVVPTMIAMLLEAARTTHCDLSSLKTISYGGAPIAAGLLQAALDRFGNVFVQVYGSCEAPHPMTVLSRSDHLALRAHEHRFGSIGREVLTAEIRVVGADGTDMADGEQGEMWLRGPNVMRGYWNNPSATSDVFADGWYKSGDVCYRDADGFYYIVDRARDMVISGGLNIYPAEVETALYRHPAVAEAAVIGVPDDVWGESVKAFVVVRPGEKVSEPQLIDHCKALLAGYKKPRSVEFVTSLPKGPTGKILKRDLQAPYWSGRSRRVN
jgi:acyl-CoA synthetase (AMP-forming)/AMP-acid ligase II